jgi:hypothetical protein
MGWPVEHAILALDPFGERFEDQPGVSAISRPFAGDAIVTPASHIGAEALGERAGVPLQRRRQVAGLCIGGTAERGIKETIFQCEMRHQLSGELPAEPSDA